MSEQIVEVVASEDVKNGMKEFAQEILKQFGPAVNEQHQQSRIDQLLELLLADKAEEIVKKQADKEQRAKAQQDMIRTTKEYEALVKAGQDACSHTKENGRTAINGQIHNDGFYHPFCQRCFKTFPLHRPTAEQMPRGVQVL